MSPHTRHDPAAPTGAEATTLYVAIEISRKSWVSRAQEPGEARRSGCTRWARRTSRASRA